MSDATALQLRGGVEEYAGTARLNTIISAVTSAIFATRAILDSTQSGSGPGWYVAIKDTTILGLTVGLLFQCGWVVLRGYRLLLDGHVQLGADGLIDHRYWWRLFVRDTPRLILWRDIID